jgi:iron complex transport system substrate-binding protein
VGTIGAPNLEKILELQPDLILSNVSRDEANYSLLSEIAPTILAAKLGAVWRDNFRLYAQALGKQTEGEAVIAAYDQQIADLRTQLDTPPEEIEISKVRFVDEGIIRAYHRGSFIGSILDDVGFARPATQQEPETSWTAVPMELLTDLDGDVIFYAIYGDPEETSLTAVQERALWAQLTAVQDVSEVNGDLLVQWFGYAASNTCD